MRSFQEHKQQRCSTSGLFVDKQMFRAVMYSLCRVAFIPEGIDSFFPAQNKWDEKTNHILMQMVITHLSKKDTGWLGHSLFFSLETTVCELAAKFPTQQNATLLKWLKKIVLMIEIIWLLG